MKRSTKIITISLLLILFFLPGFDCLAQCAMCKANAESSLRNGPSVARGLNSGILYLMTIPYLLLAFIFRQQIKSLYYKIKSRFLNKIKSRFLTR